MARMRRSLRALAAAVAVVAPFAISACGASESGSASKTLTLGTPADIATFDPYMNGLGYGVQFLQPSYDTLIRLNSDNRLAPGLAVSWRYATPKSLELKLRKGVTFSDGAPFDATAVKGNLERVKSVSGPKTAQLAGSLASVEVVDDMTVRLELTAPNPSLPFELSQVLGMMVSPKALADPAKLAQSPAGAGPYVLDRQATVPHSQMTFVRRKGYWNARAVPYDKIVVKIIPNADGLLNALRSGQIDAAPFSSPQSVAPAERAGLTVQSAPNTFTGVFLWDRDGKLVKPLRDVRVRQALNYAIDRRAIVKGVAQGHGRPGTQIFCPSSGGNLPALDERYPYDPTKAKALLAKAGYESGFELPVLSNQLVHTEVESIASYLRAVGVGVKISDTSNTSDFTKLVVSGKVATGSLVFGCGDMYEDAQNLLGPRGALNPFRTGDPKIDRLMRRIPLASAGRQPRLFQQLSAAVVDKAWFLITDYRESFYIISDRVHVPRWAGQIVPSIWAFRPAA